MAHDKTPERNNLIFIYTLLSVAALIALAFVFESYFAIETDREMDAKVRSQPATELQDVRSSQQEELRSGPVPIEQAMGAVARQERPEVVRPAASDDRASLEGWNEARMGPGVPAELLEEADAGVPADAAVAATDGAAPEADGGVAPESNTGDTSPSTGGGNDPTPGARGAGGSAGPED